MHPAYTDLVTLRVSIPQPDGSMAGLTMPFLAGLSGLGERRAERAIHDLKTAGIITVHSLCQQLEDATYKGVVSPKPRNFPFLIKSMC
jgi:hypothetical protein